MVRPPLVTEFLRSCGGGGYTESAGISASGVGAVTFGVGGATGGAWYAAVC